MSERNAYAKKMKIALGSGLLRAVRDGVAELQGRNDGDRKGEPANGRSAS